MSWLDARRVPRVRVPAWVRGRRAGQIAIAALILFTLAIVAAAAGAPSLLVPRADQAFPVWEAGPLNLLHLHPLSGVALGSTFSAVLVAMLVAYGVLLAALRTIRMRTIVIVVVALHAIVLLSPPMQLTDLFNYLGYARLGALHELNPYAHVIRQELFDPVSTFASWHDLRSPYGWLFTALTYPLAFISLPAAYWVMKVATILVSLGFVALVGDCARRLGRDPRFAVAFVAFNPIFIVYGVGGFHNDFFMLTPMMGAIALLLARRDRSAGAVLMLAVAVKFTAIVLLPFLLVAARARERQKRVLVGAAIAVVPLAALSLALFGPAIPNLSQQSSVLTGTSFPNLFGLLVGIGGATPTLLKITAVGVVVVVVHQFLRNRDWPAGAGWATLALIASLGWVMPWYVIWLLPLAALGSSVALRRVALLLTVYLVLAFLPFTANFMSQHGINLLDTHAGRVASSLQYKLAH
ncbi:MAG: glycosyltransferase family 87 protein [Solirubrobacteraceae bacterium]